MERSTENDKPLVMFAVMGATGTGKSTFIKLLTNDDSILVGHNQDSETSDIRTAHYVDQTTGHHVMLIDTPGFDDSREGMTDTDILERIVQYLEPESGEQRKLNGIIYMHRISDPRVGGVSRKNLRMFRSLCGDENLGNVRIVTTNWDRVSEREGDYREADLKSGAFKALLDAGAEMRRHTNTLESAREIMSELIPLRAVTMQIQEEVREGKKLADTAAGQVLTEQMREMQRRHEKELADLRREMEAAAKANNRALREELEQERKVLEERIAAVEADRERLERTLEEQREALRNQDHEENAIMMRLMEQLVEERRQMQAQLAQVNEHQTQLREQAFQRQLELEREIAEANRRIVELQNRDTGGGCIIC